MTTQYLRLKENHPTMVKLNKLFELADELGISISYHCSGPVVQDDEWEGEEINLRDIEDEGSRTYAITTFPPTTEWRAIVDNPKYIEEENKRREEYNKKIAEEKRIAEENKLAKEKKLEDARLERIKISELELLKNLKAKYES